MSGGLSGISVAVAALILILAAPARMFAQDKSPPPLPPSTQTAPLPPSPAEPADPFGQEVTLDEKTIVYFSGQGAWDTAFEAILDGFKTVYGFLDKQGIKPTGAAMIIYTSTDDAGFRFQAAVPVAEAPVNPPKGDIAVGKSPSGKAFKFVHRGSYDSMDTTYEAITNFLDAKGIDAKELFLEEYITNPITTPEDKLVIEIYVPMK